MIDVDVNKFRWSFSLVSYFPCFFHLLRKSICMALTSKSPPSPSSSSWISFMLSMDHTSFPKTHSQGFPVLYKQELPKEEDEEKSLCPKIEKALEESRDENDKELRSAPRIEIGKVKVSSKIRKRPTRLLVPESISGLEFGEVVKEASETEFELEGKFFFMASRKGRKNVMEDGYQVITDIIGNSKQAFFGVFDGHGGRAAANFVAEHLGKNIVKYLRDDEGIDQSKDAIREGYLVTDKEFLTQNVGSGVCAATVLVKDGKLYVANVGDCRVVLSRKGVATALTSDHRLDRADERLRIENMGGYVNCQNGVWRVQGSLAVSRAIGDLHLKQWVISEPEIKNLQLTPDCEFLVIASDGLWDKVSNQEAVDIVLGNENSVESCKKLVDMSFSRGNRDDITVMVVHLQNFK